MKKTIFIFLLSFLVNHYSIGQNFPNTSSTWTIAFIEMGSFTSNFTCSLLSDTTINDHSYKKIYVCYDSVFNKENSFYDSAIRESEGKWFFVPEDMTVEYLLYDFNAEIGDTIKVDNPWTSGEGDLIVFETDSVELFDGYHKSLKVGIYDRPSEQPMIIDTWIKGIGSTKGLFYSGDFVFDIGHELLCFHNNNDLVYLNSPDGTCGYIKVSNKAISTQSDIKISPNPVKDFFNIEVQDDFFVEIYDVTAIQRIKSNKKSIDISSLESGIYFVRIFDSSRQLLKTEKLLKQ